MRRHRPRHKSASSRSPVRICGLLYSSLICTGNGPDDRLRMDINSIFIRIGGFSWAVAEPLVSSRHKNAIRANGITQNVTDSAGCVQRSETDRSRCRTNGAFRFAARTLRERSYHRSSRTLEIPPFEHQHTKRQQRHESTRTAGRNPLVLTHPSPPSVLKIAVPPRVLMTIRCRSTGLFRSR